VGDAAVVQHPAAEAFEQGLGEVEGEAGGLHHRPLKGDYLLFDVIEAVCHGLAGTVHGEGCRRGLGHQTTRSRKRSASGTRS
jgi:hypothetical protein